MGGLESGYQRVCRVNGKGVPRDGEIQQARADLDQKAVRNGRAKTEAAINKLEVQRTKLAARIAERDERIAETRRRADDDRQEVVAVGEELIALYGDPDVLLKHARVVGQAEIEENEFNLNVPRYVDTFEPEPRVEVREALEKLREMESEVQKCEDELRELLQKIGYAQ